MLTDNFSMYHQKQNKNSLYKCGDMTSILSVLIGLEQNYDIPRRFICHILVNNEEFMPFCITFKTSKKQRKNNIFISHGILC